MCRLDDPDKLGLTPENVIKFYELTKKMEQDEDYDVFNTWNIKRGEPTNDSEPQEIDEDVVEISDDGNFSESGYDNFHDQKEK